MTATTRFDDEARSGSEQILAIYAAITAACVFAGLGAADTEDISQDICEWLLRSGNLEAAALAPWLAAVTTNYIRRYRRSRAREAGAMRNWAIEAERERRDWHGASEAKLFLDRLTSRMSGCDRRLLLLMREGLRLSEAADRAGIPKGSEQYRLRNLRRKALSLRRPRRPGETDS